MPNILSTAMPEPADFEAEVCTQYTPLVEGVVQRLHVPASLRDDARQEGFIGLLSAVERYDATSPVHFAVFAKTYVMGAITRRIYTRTQLTEVVDGGIEVDDNTLHAESYDIESQVLLGLHLEAWMATLSPSESRLLRRLYWNDATSDALAEEMGVSRRRVNQIHRSLLRRGAHALAEDD